MKKLQDHDLFENNFQRIHAKDGIFSVVLKFKRDLIINCVNWDIFYMGCIPKSKRARVFNIKTRDLGLKFAIRVYKFIICLDSYYIMS